MPLVGIRELSSNDLVRLCAIRGGAEEWLEFVQRFTRPITITVLRVTRLWGASTAAIDDMVQDVFLKFCEHDRKILRDFKPLSPDSFHPFLKTVAAATANDYFRRRHSAKRGGGKSEEQVTEAHPSESSGAMQSIEWMERNLLLREIDQLLASTSQQETNQRDRTVFWLYYQQGMTAAAIAGLPGVGLTVKGVESALHRMTSLLRNHIGQPSSAISTKGIPDREGFPPPSAVQKGEWI